MNTDALVVCGLIAFVVMSAQGAAGPGTCPGVSAPANGIMCGDGKSINFICDYGYGLQGSAKIDCDGGKWTGPSPKCVERKCNMPLGLKNGAVRGSNSVGETINFYCNPGFVRQGNEKLLCTDDRQKATWNGKAPTCVGTCPPLPATFNGHIEGDNIVGSKVKFTCHEDYELQGSETIECLSGGKWSGPAPVCLGKCPPFELRNGKAVGSRTVGKGFHLSCNPGYTLRRSSWIGCKPDGWYSGNQPECVGVRPTGQPTVAPTRDVPTCTCSPKCNSCEKCTCSWGRGDRGVCEKMPCPKLSVPVCPKLHKIVMKTDDCGCSHPRCQPEVVPTSEALTCKDQKGNLRQEGDHWMGDCHNCTCANGQAVCDWMLCRKYPFPDCPNGAKPVVGEDNCGCPSPRCQPEVVPPTCEGEDENLHQEGDNWMSDCDRCTCAGGKEVCVRMPCPTSVPPDCADGTKLVMDTDECGCSHPQCQPEVVPPTCEGEDGNLHQEGDNWMADCDRCTCAGGKEVCVRMPCPTSVPPDCPSGAEVAEGRNECGCAQLWCRPKGVHE